MANAAAAQSGSDPTGQPFTISRLLDAPRELVWKAWSEKDQLQKWWGPKGFAIAVQKKLGFQPQGVFHYSMTAANGSVMWGRFVYQDIVPPEKIVWLNSFSGPDGSVTRAPFPGMELWPLEVTNTVSMAGDGAKTHLTLRAYPHNASVEERLFFEGFFASLTQGFGGTLDQLEAHLAQQQGRPS